MGSYGVIKENAIKGKKEFRVEEVMTRGRIDKKEGGRRKEREW